MNITECSRSCSALLHSVDESLSIPVILTSYLYAYPLSSASHNSVMTSRCVSVVLLSQGFYWVAH